MSCYLRANATCSGDCVTNDTFYITPTNGTLSAYKVDNSYYAAPQTFIPKSCLDLYKSTNQTTGAQSFDSALLIGSTNLAKSKTFWDTWQIGFEGGLFLFAFVFAVVAVRRAMQNADSDRG